MQPKTVTDLPRHRQSIVACSGRSAKDFFRHKDRERWVKGDRHRDRVARPSVNFDQLTAAGSQMQLREICVFGQVADHDLFNRRVQRFGNVDDQIMCQRTRRNVVIFDSAIDVGSFKDSDHDRELTRPVDFLEINHLVIG